MTAPNAAGDDSTVPAALSTPMGDEPADHHAREDEQADGDGEAEPEGQAGKSGHFTPANGKRETGNERDCPARRWSAFIRLPFSVSRFPAPA